MQGENKVVINNETNGKIPNLPFDAYKNEILGKDYELGITFINPKKSKTLNKEYRNKDKSTDILSFPVTENEGDIFIDIETSKIEMKKFGRNLDNFIAFLLIHGMLHLKGMEHGSRMEGKEKKFRKIFSI